MQEPENLLVAGTEDDVGIPSAQSGQHADIAVHHRAGVLRIGSQRSVRVRRDVDLGNHLNLPLRGVGYDLADVVLRVEASDGRRFTRLRIAPRRERKPRAVDSPCPDLRQSRITLDFQAPAVVVRQVQVQFVEFELRHVFDQPQQPLPAEAAAPQSGKIRLTLPKTPARIPFNPDYAGIIIGALCIVVGLFFFATTSSSVSSTSFGADFYTYVYRGVVATAELLVRLIKLLSLTLVLGGAALECHYIRRLLQNRPVGQVSPDDPQDDSDKKEM